MIAYIALVLFTVIIGLVIAAAIVVAFTPESELIEMGVQVP